MEFKNKKRHFGEFSVLLLSHTHILVFWAVLYVSAIVYWKVLNDDSSVIIKLMVYYAVLQIKYA